jgi:hypothetical protein
MNFIRHMHATLNQIYVYVLSRVVVTESIIILCGCCTSFSPLTKRPIDKNRQADSACDTLDLLQAQNKDPDIFILCSKSLFHCHIDPL